MTFMSLHEYIKKYFSDNYDSLQSSIIANDLKTSFPTKIKSPCIKSDWVCDISKYKEYIKRLSTAPNFCVCVIPDEEWVKNVTQVERNLFLQTGYKECVWLVDTTIMKAEINNQIYTVWIGEICKLKDIINNTGLRYILTKEDRKTLLLSNTTEKMPKLESLKARCEKSMYMFDEIHRKYIDKFDFKINDIVAVKSVAGSGKTTTLLSLARNKPKTKILYMAFNKSLINEINTKIKTHNIQNLNPCTFDSLMYKLYINQGKLIDKISNLNPYLLTELGLMSSESYREKKTVCDIFDDFCASIEYHDIYSYCSNKSEPKPSEQHTKILIVLWEKAKECQLITFNIIRKLAYINNWCYPYIDTHYDMIMIDETQDFDLMMLQMLLNDTTIPKLFVGDPNQSIYKFRGNIDAFDYLPSSSKIIEFYSTFRVGNPACKEIAEQIPNCWMISKSDHVTKLVSNFSPKCSKYTYLFRTWRHLLQSASKIEHVWINNYERKKADIQKMHKYNMRYKNTTIDASMEDTDLPKFLKSITSRDLDKLFEEIEANLVSYEKSKVKCYTIHAYKGLEDDYVRISGDVLADREILAKPEKAQERNLYYVAITRGMLETMKVFEQQNNNTIASNTVVTKINTSATKDFEVDTEHNMLKMMLENWLEIKSKNLFKPKHAILTTKNVVDIIHFKPKTLSELQMIPGIGIIKLKAYGKELIKVIQEACVYS